jgi:hypothetical protein
MVAADWPWESVAGSILDSREHERSCSTRRARILFQGKIDVRGSPLRQSPYSYSTVAVVVKVADWIARGIASPYYVVSTSTGTTCRSRVSRCWNICPPLRPHDVILAS